MVVYHGTDSLSAEDIIKNGIDLSRGEYSVDNGKGFYMTPNYVFALKRAETSAHSRSSFAKTNVRPVVLQVDFELPDDDSDISVKKFDGVTYSWKEFVFYNRVGFQFLRKWKIVTDNHNLDLKYDVVIDETADNAVSSIVSALRYEKNEARIKEVINKIEKSQKSYWGKQISVHSKKGLSCIKSIKIFDPENA